MSFIPPNEDELAAVQRLRNRIDEHFSKQDSSDENTDGSTSDENSSKSAKILPPKFTDTKLLRFYRGMKHEEDDAFNSLVTHTKWYAGHEVDRINDNTHQFEKELNAKKVIILDGLDHNQRPVSMCYVHRHNAKDRDVQQIRMLIIHTLEGLVKKAKFDEEKFIIGFDLSRFTFQCMDYECVKALIGIIQFNYPETLYVCLVIDAPLVFRACWQIIKPWLDPVTQAKVIFIKRAQIGDYMDPSMVPADL